MNLGTPLISEVIGEGAEAHRLVQVGSWMLTAWARLGDGEPRIRDIDLAERLGYAEPRTIRRLIKRMAEDGKLAEISQRVTVTRREGQVAPQKVTEFWLTEAQALKVSAKSETEVADSILDEVIRVYMLARRGLLGQHPQQAPIDYQAMAVVVASAAAQAAAAALAPIVARLDRIEARGEAQPEAGRWFACEVCRKLREYAMLLAPDGDREAVKRFRGKGETELRGHLGHTGRGSSWSRLDGGKMSAARKELDRMLDLARDVAAQREPKQRRLFDDQPEKPN